MRLDPMKLEIIMAKKCFSMKELKKCSGVGGPTIPLMLRGRRNCRPATIGRIAAALGVDVTELLQDSED